MTTGSTHMCAAPQPAGIHPSILQCSQAHKIHGRCIVDGRGMSVCRRRGRPFACSLKLHWRLRTNPAFLYTVEADVYHYLSYVLIPSSYRHCHVLHILNFALGLITCSFRTISVTLWLLLKIYMDVYDEHADEYVA